MRVLITVQTSLSTPSSTLVISSNHKFTRSLQSLDQQVLS